MAENLPEPESRKEAYLAKAAGVSVEELPTPASREELYLNAIANGGGGGGGSVTVVQTIGTSTTDVMSQDATTKMIFADPSDGTQIQIGKTTYTSGASAIAIGRETICTGNGSVALGRGAHASNANSVAIGRTAETTQNGEVNIGSSNSSYGYSNSNYRLLSGVYDPQSAHDAATKGYVDGLVGNIESALNAINNGGGN